MSPASANFPLDYLLFAGITVLLLGLAQGCLVRREKRSTLPGVAWLIVLVLLVLAWWMTGRAGERERAQIERLVSAMAPTYAMEMTRRGHAEITPETPPDDARRVELLATVSAWEKSNVMAHDIYTMRRMPDGSRVFIVDADSDYDRDGKIAEHEEGAALGEVYEEEDPGMDLAFEGHANFETEPVTDRWGTWVTAFAPIYDAQGRVEGILGVDFDAHDWFAAIAGARRERLIQFGLLLAAVIGGSVVVGLLRGDNAVLRDAESRYRQVLERGDIIVQQMPLAFTEWTPSGEVLAWNPAAERIFGFKASEILGRNGFALIVPKKHQPRVDAIWQKLLANTGGQHNENENLTKDGRTIICEWFNTRLVDHNGAVVAVMAIAQEVTERRSLEAQVLQSQKMQAVGLLAAGVAHDFNNILTIVQGHADLLLGRQDLAREAREDVGRIATAAERAANLTRQLLSFSRRQAMFTRPIDLNATVRGCATMLERVIGANIKLHCDFAATLPSIEADPTMMDQVITNLAVNARDAMPRGGTLTLGTSLVEITAEAVQHQPEAVVGRAVRLSVGDTGSGITPEQLPHIFEPFFTTKEIGKGTGLGLAAVHGIVKQHGGWIEVRSEVGSGTTVEVFLPPGTGTVAVEIPRAAAASEHDAAGRTILLVEDEASVRSLARGALTRAGYRVIEAEDGRKAETLWAANRDTIDLLFTDMVMPGGLSGRELADICLADNARLPVLYTSGYSVEFTAPDFSETAGRVFLQKPYVPQDLLGAVQRCFGDGAA